MERGRWKWFYWGSGSSIQKPWLLCPFIPNNSPAQESLICTVSPLEPGLAKNSCLGLTRHKQEVGVPGGAGQSPGEQQESHDPSLAATLKENTNPELAHLCGSCTSPQCLLPHGEVLPTSNLLFLQLLLCFWDRVLPCSPHWLWTCCTAQVAFQLTTSCFSLSSIGIISVHHLAEYFTPFFGLAWDWISGPCLDCPLLFIYLYFEKGSH